MAHSRMEVLKSMLEQDPRNSFARYGLAMEYANAGDYQAAVAEYEALLTQKPDYIAAYFHGARALESLGRRDEARALYHRGIEAATRLGDRHARDEMQAALEALE